jgi:biopolymer transport protein ExbB
MELLIYIMMIASSVIGLTFILERALVLRWRRIIPPDVESAAQNSHSAADVETVRRVCQKRHSPLSRLLLMACDQLEWPKAENVDALQTQARHEIVHLERGLVVLEILVGIAPLLGLVGTIYGMMRLFGELGQTGITDATRLAQGIGMILHTTMMGLLIAIPSLVFWSYYTKRVEVLATEMERICGEFIRRQYMGRD